MRDEREPDYYEILQVSPRADQETIDRVFRHLAKRYHPDHSASGDPDRFAEVVDAFRILSDPEERADYDARYDAIRREQWEIFSQESADDNVEEDRRIRLGILSALYTARRNDVDRPGMGALELERLLACPQEHMKFHIWYLKENGWLQRLENGMFAITASGVDRVLEMGTPWQQMRKRLHSGNGDEEGVQLEEEEAVEAAEAAS
jgi:curved DNA-binding protein CbpA